MIFLTSVLFFIQFPHIIISLPQYFIIACLWFCHFVSLLRGHRSILPLTSLVEPSTVQYINILTWFGFYQLKKCDITRSNCERREQKQNCRKRGQSAPMQYFPTCFQVMFASFDERVDTFPWKTLCRPQITFIIHCPPNIYCTNKCR